MTQNILAFILPIFLFFYWTIIGFSALTLLRIQRNLLQNAFLAPSIGICIILLPFFWLSRLGFPVSQFAKPFSVLKFLTLVYLCLFISFILLNNYFFDVVHFLLIQVNLGMGSLADVFPYFLRSDSFPELWGTKALAVSINKTYDTLVIYLALLFTTILYISLQFIKTRMPVVIVFLSMLLLGSVFFIKQLGFGLFKLAMYIQSFLLAVFAISLVNISKRKKFSSKIDFYY